MTSAGFFLEAAPISERSEDICLVLSVCAIAGFLHGPLLGLFEWLFFAALLRFSLSADITRSKNRAATDAEQIRADLRVMVNDMILASERQQKDDLTVRLVALESQLQNAHQADLVRLAASIEEQRTRIKTIERDIDRREGLNLADILFSELNGNSDERPTDKKSGD